MNDTILAYYKKGKCKNYLSKTLYIFKPDFYLDAYLIHPQDLYLIKPQQLENKMMLYLLNLKQGHGLYSQLIDDMFCLNMRCYSNPAA